MSRSRQKSYADKRRRPLEFVVGDHVFLRLNPTTGVGRVVRPKKLSPKFVGPYQILRRIGPVAYELSLPPQLSNLHPVFHVSQLRKYIADPSHVLELEDVRLRQDRTLEMQPVRVEDSHTKYYKRKAIRLVKVVWEEKTGDSTWEVKDAMRDLYPHLFPVDHNRLLESVIETLQQQNAALVQQNTIALQSLEAARANSEATQRQLMEIVATTRNIVGAFTSNATHQTE
ncbi:uncharacterized protein LOC124844347 [Vigna umbellata]|uniref:uncharacterized protein LOC124844347 n=1 Tax=Vigna umbellata TaxID=87088 RepID=UPI001F5E82E7|nr:uncharacterized protein LOC124844347 [Vigna umbellata]